MPHDQVTKILGSNGVTATSVTTRGSKGAVAVELLDASGNQISSLSSLVSAAFDYISVASSNSNGDPLIIQYYTGGAAGTLVTTLTLTYDSNNNFLTLAKT